MQKKGRAASGDRNGLRKHPNSVLRGEKHPNSRLTKDSVLSIRESFKNKVSVHTLADKFNIKAGTVYDIVLQRSWKHV
jgi:hypothetical protein